MDFESLNNEQIEAVKSDGAIRVIAGPGTGKTHTLISRIIYLINEKKIPASQILTLTFTHKASLEVISRLNSKKIYEANVYTFHSFAAKILRKFWKPDFKIINEEEQEKIITSFLNKNELKNFNLKDIVHDFSLLRNGINSDFQSKFETSRIKDIFSSYTSELEHGNFLDFDSLLYKILEIPEIKNLYRYILVDEYQDVNHVQIEILKKIFNENIWVVGDCDQSIYSFRGVSPNTMQDFTKIFPNAKTIILNKNYRNTPSIINSSQKLIRNNSHRINSTLEAVNKDISPVFLFESNNDYESNDMLFHLLELFIGSPSSMHDADSFDKDETALLPFNDIAILYRTQNEGKILEAQLFGRGYPSVRSNKEAFFEKPEIKKFISQLELLLNINNFTEKENFSSYLRKKIDEYTSFNNIKKSAIKDIYHLLNYALAFDNLELKEALIGFLDMIKTREEADNLIDSDKINLLTFHASKGLEFPIVFIFGLEEDNIPHKRSADSPLLIQEERRLLYVGMTRAKEKLYLFTNMKNKDSVLKPSKFLQELESSKINLPENRKIRIKKRIMKEAQMQMF